MKIIENFWLILFILWSLPLMNYRSKFRKMVYRTDSWTINFKPRFGKELKAIFGNIYPYDKSYLKMRNFYLVDLTVHLVLLAGHLKF